MNDEERLARSCIAASGAGWNEALANGGKVARFWWQSGGMG
jgi:hypothetical protein